VLFYLREYINSLTGSVASVRRRRVLLWRTRHWWQRTWPGAGDLPDHLLHGRIPRESLTGPAGHQGLQPAIIPKNRRMA
jgi:hypothetical protein